MTDEWYVVVPQLNVDYGNVPRLPTRLMRRNIDRCIYRSQNNNNNNNPRQRNDCRHKCNYLVDRLSSMEDQVYRHTPASYQNLYNRAIVELLTTLEYVDERKRPRAGEQAEYEHVLAATDSPA